MAASAMPHAPRSSSNADGGSRSSSCCCSSSRIQNRSQYVARFETTAVGSTSGGIFRSRPAPAPGRPAPGGPWPCPSGAAGCRGDRQPAIDCRLRLGVAPEPEQGDAWRRALSAERGSTRCAFVKRSARRLPPPQALLGPAGGAQQVRVRRAPSCEPRLVGRERAAGCRPDELLVVAQRELGLRSLRRQSLRPAPPRRARRPHRSGWACRSCRCRSAPATAAPTPARRSSRAPPPGRSSRWRGGALARIGRRQPLAGFLAFEERLVGGEVLGRLLRQRLLLRAPSATSSASRHPARDVGLHLEHVGDRRVERLLPGGRGGADLDQLGAHPHPVPGGRLLPAHRRR